MLRLKEVLYNLGRSNLTSICDDRSTDRPQWTVFHTQIQNDILCETSEIIFNPILLAPPNDLNAVYTTLVRTKEQMHSLGQFVCPIVFDMGLLTKALEITWAYPNEFESVLPMEGGMHFMMSVFGGIGHIYGDAGLKQLMTDSDVFARLTADHILSGKDFDRAVRAVLIIDEALSVGDAYFQHKSFDRIRELRKQGTTLLFVSHDKGAIQSICDRVILLEEGVVTMVGGPEQVMDYYNARIAERENQTVRQEENEQGQVQTITAL